MLRKILAFLLLSFLVGCGSESDESDSGDLLYIEENYLGRENLDQSNSDSGKVDGEGGFLDALP